MRNLPGIALVFVAAAVLAVAGCAPRTSDTEITVWTMWTGQEEKNFEAVLRRYEQLHPGVHIRNLGAVSDDTKTVRAIVAGVPPDFFTIADASYLGPLARNNAILPLDDLFRHSTLKESSFVPAALGMCRYHGALYGLPFLIDGTALIWNRGDFKAAGLPPDEPPRTLEQYADMAVKLSTKGPDGSITRLGVNPLDDINLVIHLFGGRLTDPVTGRITADDPANVAAVTWYKEFTDRLGGVEKVRAFASGFGQSQGVSNPFYVDKISMMDGGEWNPYWLSRYAPNLSYGVAPMPPPAAHPELANSTWMGGNVFCIPKESRHPKEAWDFLVWTQSVEAQVMFAKRMNNVPNQRAALTAPQLIKGASYRSMYAKFLKLADTPNAGYFPVLPVSRMYISELGNALDKVLYGDLTPAAALAGVRVRVQRELDRS